MNLSIFTRVNPDMITGVSLMLLFVFTKAITQMGLGFFTMLLAHITFIIPYVILSVLPKLKQLNKHVKLHWILGQLLPYALWKVVIPEIMPGIITGLYWPSHYP